VCTIAPELPGALEAVAALSGRGTIVSLGHSACSAELADEAASAGARLVTHLGNAMGPLHHRAPGLLGAALTDDRLTVSVIADLVHTHASFLTLAFRAKGPAAVALVTDAVSTRTPTAAPVTATPAVGGAPGPPRLPDGTLAGSVLTMAEALHSVTERCGVSLVDAVRASSTTPAALLGMHDRGAVAPGRRADLVALEAGPGGWHVAATWVAGVQSWPRAPRSAHSGREGQR
jgi:N-acetylglucosamine-6-phosphate deacetylase